MQAKQGVAINVISSKFVELTNVHFLNQIVIQFETSGVKVAIGSQKSAIACHPPDYDMCLEPSRASRFIPIRSPAGSTAASPPRGGFCFWQEAVLFRAISSFNFRVVRLAL